MVNKRKLRFETTAEIRTFIKRRKISNWKIDTTDVVLIAVLNEKDIEIASKDYQAKLVNR